MIKCTNARVIPRVAVLSALAALDLAEEEEVEVEAANSDDFELFGVADPVLINLDFA